ncbi:LOW QUALITY PROTEIN: uncharacterized protein LOC113797393 [Dermatophagoides pteronyssinus]|uniref:LOW QUALITY PROTEIN: uncharacterized protein LOC113797393 n=1 Tax=Dermatophagoides pteronyssinus TaxID=6956 RepID=UPI003F66BDFA
MPPDVHIEQQTSLSQYRHLSSPPSPSSSSSSSLSSSSTTTSISVKERCSMSEQTDINIAGCSIIDGQSESIYMQRYQALRDAGFDETTANKYSPLYSSVNEVIDAILSQSLNDNSTINDGRTLLANKGKDNNSYSSAIYSNGDNKSSTIMTYNDISPLAAAELLSQSTDSISINKTNNNNNLIMECIHGQSPPLSKRFLCMAIGDSNGSVIDSNDLIVCSPIESYHHDQHFNANGNYSSLSNCIGNIHQKSLMKKAIISSESPELSIDHHRSNGNNLIVTMLKDGLLEDSNDEITLEDDVGLLADGQNGNGSPSASSSLSSGISSSFFMDTSSSSPSSFSSLSSSISISPPSNQSIVANFENHHHHNHHQQPHSINNNKGNHHQTLSNDNGTLISLFLSKQQKSSNNNNVENNGKIKSTSAKTITTIMNDSNDIIISNGYNNNNHMHNGINNNNNNNNNETNDLNCETFSFSLDNLSISSSSSTSSSSSSNTTTMKSNQQKNDERSFDGLLDHHHSMIIGNNKLSYNSNNRSSIKVYGNGNDSSEDNHHHYQQNNDCKSLHPVNGNSSDNVSVVEPNSFNDTGFISGVDGCHHNRNHLHFPSTTIMTIDKLNVDGSCCNDLLFDNHDQHNHKTTNDFMMKSCQPMTFAAGGGGGCRNSDDTLNDLLGYLNLQQQQLFTNNQPQQQLHGNNFDLRNRSMLATVSTATSSPPLSSVSSNSLSTTTNNNNDVITSSKSSSFDENGVNLKNTAADIFNNVENNTTATIVGVLNEMNNHYHTHHHHHHHQNNNNNCNNKNNYNNISNNLNLFSSSTPSSSSSPVSMNTTSTSLLIDTFNTMNDSIFNHNCSSESVNTLEQQHHQLNHNRSPNNYHQHQHHHHSQQQQQYHTFLSAASNHHPNHQKQQPRTFADIAASSLNGHHNNGIGGNTGTNNGNNVLNGGGVGSNNIDLVDSSSFLNLLDSSSHKSFNGSNNGSSNGYFNAFTSSSNISVNNPMQSFYDQFNADQNGLNKKYYRKQQQHQQQQQQTQVLNFRAMGASPLSPSMSMNDANKLLKSGQIKESQLGFIRSPNGSLTITDCGGHIGIGDNGFESNGITMNENSQSSSRPTNLMGYKGLWVCNVSPEVGLHYLKRRFRRYGHFTGIQTFERRATNGTNIVFVHYDNPNSPVEAIIALHNYNGQDLCADPNEPLKLRFAPSMEQSRAGQLPTLEQARKIVEKSGECFNWRLSSGCHRGQRCHLKHISINKEIDSQPWVKALKKKINET